MIKKVKKTVYLKILSIQFISLFIFVFVKTPVFSASNYTCSVNNQKVTKLSPEFFNISLPSGYVPLNSSMRLEFFKSLKDAGVHTIRHDVLWKTVEKNKGVYNWAKNDQLLKDAEQSGLKVLIILMETPDWAKLNGKRMIDPKYYNDWQDFVSEATRRYNMDNGTIAKVSSTFEIWNEPYNTFEGTPAQMLETLNLAYTAIKKTNPKSLVMIPSANYLDSEWTTVLIGGKYDIYNLHIYSGLESSVDIIQKFKKSIGNKKLAITETNIGFPGRSCSFVNNHSEKQMADMLVDRYVCTATAGADYVYYFSPFDLIAKPCKDEGGLYKIGFYQSQIDYRNPRPIYTALKNMTTALIKQSILGDINSDGSVNLIDYSVWKREYLSQNGLESDINNDRVVNLLDFEIWKKYYLD